MSGDDLVSRKYSTIFHCLSNADLFSIYFSLNIVTVVSSRYGIFGSMARQEIFRFACIFIIAFIWFSNAYAGYRFFQVVVWKRVREINEELFMR